MEVTMILTCTKQVAREFVRRHIGYVEDGLILVSELDATLDREQIRGAFRSDGSWIGYDYARQQWIDTRDM